MRNRYTLISLILLISICIFTVLTAPAFNFCGLPRESQIYEIAAKHSLSAKAQRSTVSIFSVGQGFGFCSGVIIGENKGYTYVVTCKHCVSPTEEILVENSKAKAIFTPIDEDLALILVSGTIDNKEVVTVAEVQPERGDTVFHIGYPDFELFESWGSVLRDTNDWQWASLESKGGCSGGGVYNTRGELVGILWGGFPFKPISIYEPVVDIKIFMGKVNQYIDLK